MFEITLSTCKNKSNDIDFIMEKLRPEIKSLKGIMTYAEIDFRPKLAFAVPEDKKDYFLALLFECICETIIKSYKFEYFLNNIKLHIGNRVTEVAFLKALTMFDKASDKEIIKKHIPISGEILIDSLYNFRLWELEKHWNEVVKLVDENKGYLLLTGSFTDLMKFLLLSIESEIDEVHLYSKNDSVFCQNKRGETLFEGIYQKDSDDNKIAVISELISLAPEKIVLHLKNDNADLTAIIKNLFELKVEEK